MMTFGRQSRERVIYDVTELRQSSTFLNPSKKKTFRKKNFFLFFTDAAVRSGEPRAFVSDDEHVSGACAQKESQQQQYKMFNESSLNSNNKRRSKNEIKRNEKPTDKLAATRESIHIWRQRCRTRLRAQQHRS